MTAEKQPRCLAIETSSPVSSLAANADGRIAVAEYASVAGESRDIYRRVRKVLDGAGILHRELDFIAFGCGPGAFTGLRVGAAAAQSMAYGLDLPVARVSSLAALAWTAMCAHGVGRVAAAVDARMGEAYFGLYERDGDGVRIIVDDCLIDPVQLRLDANAFAAGSAWTVFAGLADANQPRLTGIDAALQPRAEAVLKLGIRAYLDGQVVAAHAAVPNYVRNKVTS